MQVRVRFTILVTIALLGVVGAQPKVRSVTIEGFKVTKPQAVLEAANVHEGMEFDEQKIRQVLLELGLFDSVAVQHQSLPDNSVAVTIVVKEKSLPTPTTEAAAKALDLPALAFRLLENEAGNLSLDLKGGFTFGSYITLDLPEWIPSKKTSWSQKFIQWRSKRDKQLKESLLKELDNFLHRYPKDVEARLARAVLLAETEKADQLKEALSELQRLLIRNPNLHSAYSLRLTLLFSTPFILHLLLPTNLPQKYSEQFTVTVTGEVSKPTLEPKEIAWLRGEISLAVEEGERHFRQLPDKQWDKEAIKAAAKFFNEATSSNFLLTITETIKKIAEEYGEEFLPPERLVEPMTRYFSDFMRISRIARHFAKDAEVQWSMVVWGSQLVTGLLMTSLPAIVSEHGDDTDDNHKLSQFGTAIFVHRNLYRPALEQWGWHLNRVISLDKKRKSMAFALLALQKAVLGDFHSARRAIENGLRQTQPDEQSLAKAIGLTMFFEAMAAASTRPSEEQTIIAAVRRRYSDWVNELRRSYPSMPYLAFVQAILHLAEHCPIPSYGETAKWESIPESARREAIKILQNSAKKNPKSDFAQRVFGLTSLLEGKVEEALQHLRKAYELKSEWLPNGYALAVGYLMAGDTEKALSLFRSKP
ncbi:MAG: hypothetical protein NZ805_12935 [Armatimonadetes bacterium]|nr:hypothetical protein [Armatimonadota bacterium]MDW8027391.1 POTRA domain-containing protein [Armatimonadota bacterium]